MRITSPARALLALALLAGAAGCSDAPAEEATQTRAEAATTGPPAPPAAPSFPSGTRPDDGGQGSGNGLGVTDVRIARHSGFDRVVFDLGGDGTPGWYASYTENPRYEGSGDPITVKGDTFLMVFLAGMGMPFDTGLEPYGDDTTRVPGAGTRGVAEVAPGGVFEGAQQALIGLTGAKRPYRVFALENPTRLVVDITHG